MKAKVLFLAMVMIATSISFSFAQEPQWSGRVIATGAERAAIEATPIELRPNRPLHFYGNTVRRQYYRGTALPAPRDFANGAGALRRR